MSIYTDYGTNSSTSFIGADGGFFASLLSTFLVFFIISIVLSIVMLIAQFKIFKKLGKPGWIALIPIYNIWVLLEAVGLPGWLSIIPGVNAVAVIICNYKLAIKLGKSSLFAVCTVLFPAICIPILGFSKIVTTSDDTQTNNEVYNNYNYNYNGTQDSYANNQSVNNFTANVNPTDLNNGFNVNNSLNNFDQNNNFINNQVTNNVQSNDIFNNPPVQNNAFQNINADKICPVCQSSNNSNAMFCEKCGNKLG